jgi:LPPG:FO 2-phospho-L-lactate transferase
MILALAGGVGGAKLAFGLSRVLPAGELIVAVNTGDDFVHLGLHISPDLDTVMYTLAGIDNRQTGWGIAQETWGFMAMTERIGGETWFKLGDHDLATHVMRTQALAQGVPLSAVTRTLRERLGIPHPLVPMTDDPVRTIVTADGRRLAFQDYFVRHHCEPVVGGLDYDGAAAAHLLPEVVAALARDDLRGVVICPSNPHLSIGPMLAMPALGDALRRRSRPVLAVSPIIEGHAVKGPAAKILRELGHEPSCVAIATFYAGLIDILVIDTSDAAHAPAVRALGIEPVVTDILMRDDADRCRLARACCDHLGQPVMVP